MFLSVYHVHLSRDPALNRSNQPVFGRFPVAFQRATQPEKPKMSRVIRAFTDLLARNNAGEEVSFDVFADKLVLVVNVARL